MLQFDNINLQNQFEGVIKFDYNKSLLLGVKSKKNTMMESKSKSIQSQSIEKTKDAIIDIYNDPVMQTAIDVLPIIGNIRRLHLEPEVIPFQMQLQLHSS